ncbi:5'-nucleotidase C-terminal domain-containing protein [Faecalibacter bovis]|uniref:5'-nucleotidase C-terminal domain-containing protein n=1 Tax=Faecalibacter bovis TaxID=2898187 RepID=A0ABX7XFR7_9FLAO|nr:5'-nucleotidase C-terminal domain-containing protein [Faecalibacter bovis]QTV06439.1 5'-nucleotidase C-terminal domain-containing protein [Faecalibacter bovis]
MRNHYKTDLAIIDGSGIRKSVSKGDFTLEKVRTLLPFGNKIVVVKLLGKDFKKFIHSYLSNSKPKLIQISGATYQWNPETKELVFDDIKDDFLYSLCLNDYNFGKLSTYDEVLIDSNHIDSLEDYIVLKQYIQQLKIINPTIENRITITHE